MRRFLVTAGFLLLFTINCGPDSQDTNQYKKEGRYPQDFKTQAALLVRERNDVINIMASAGLLDREKGLFFSAKHFVGGENDGTMRVFFNGRVYDGILLTLPAITDIAIIKLDGNFNLAGFPEAYILGGETKKGDEVFVIGIHPHPPELQEGKNKIPIFYFYYDMPWSKDDFVLDRLETRVTNTSRQISGKSIEGSNLEDITNTYVELKTGQDHKFSFGGLSGGPVVNTRNEVVGVTANETQGGLVLEKEKGIIYHPWDTLDIVPVAELKKLMPYLSGIKKQ